MLDWWISLCDVLHDDCKEETNTSSTNLGKVALRGDYPKLRRVHMRCNLGHLSPCGQRTSFPYIAIQRIGAPSMHPLEDCVYILVPHRWIPGWSGPSIANLQMRSHEIPMWPDVAASGKYEIGKACQKELTIFSFLRWRVSMLHWSMAETKCQ